MKNDICQYPEIFYMYLKKNEFLFINFKTVYSLLKINLQKLKKTPDEISPVYIQMLRAKKENIAETAKEAPRKRVKTQRNRKISEQPV